jgi:hypothetical protein
MAKNRSHEKVAPQPSARFEIAAALTFHLGLGLFCAAEAWTLLSAPSSSISEYWLKFGLRVAGLAIAGIGWISGSRLAPTEKMLVSLLIIATLGGMTWIEKLEFDADDSILEPWHPEGNRLVHDGLGLSVTPPAGWWVDSRPEILKGTADPTSRGKRLWRGESAKFLRMAHKQGSSSATSTIALVGGPAAYASLSDAVHAISVHANEYSARPGVKNVTQPQLMQLDGAGALVFAFRNGNGCTSHEVVFRSGSHILTLAVDVFDETDRDQINEFLRSIRITGRQTDFNE